MHEGRWGMAVELLLELLWNLSLETCVCLCVHSCSSLCEYTWPASAPCAEWQKLGSVLPVGDVGRKTEVLVSGPGVARMLSTF